MYIPNFQCLLVGISFVITCRHHPRRVMVVHANIHTLSLDFPLQGTTVTIEKTASAKWKVHYRYSKTSTIVNIYMTHLGIWSLSIGTNRSHIKVDHFRIKVQLVIAVSIRCWIIRATMVVCHLLLYCWMRRLLLIYLVFRIFALHCHVIIHMA